MLRVWKWYQNCLAVHPVKTQTISSGFLWGIGDTLAQTVNQATINQHRQSSVGDEGIKIDWKRVAFTSMFGFVIVGPGGHYWYQNLDRVLTVRFRLAPKSARLVAAKVAIEGLIFAPLDLLVFFSYMGFSSGKSFAQVKEDVKRDFVPAMVVQGGVWPIVQSVNFRFVPVRHQLLYVNTLCIFDSAFLSWVDQQKNAPWKKWFTSILSSKEQEGLEGDRIVKDFAGPKGST